MKGEQGADIYPVIRRVFLYCNCLFCIAMKLDKRNTVKVNAIGNWMQIVVTSFQAVVVFSYLGAAIRSLSFDNPYKILNRLQFSETCTLSIIGLYLWRRYQTRLKNVFDFVGKVNGVLQPRKEQERHLRRKTTQWMLLFALTLLLHLSTFHIIQRSGSIIAYFGQIWLLVQIFLPDIFLWMILTMSGYYLDNLSSELRDISKGVKARDASPRRQSRPRMVRRGKCAFERGERVRELREMLRQIDLIAEELEKIFGTGLMLSTLHTFLDFVYFIFVNITMVRYFTSDFTTDTALITFQINLWMLIYVYRFFQVLGIASDFAEKGRRLPIVVHELLNEDVHDCPKKELAIFSLSLLHRKNEISGRGLDIDFRLIPTVISATVMQVMMLLQFNFPGCQNGIQPFEDLTLKR